MAALNHKQKLFICRGHAEFKTVRQIIDEFNAVFGFKPYNSQIIWYRDASKWPGVVKELREAWTKALAQEAIANKRIRLRMLQEVFDRAMEPAYAGTDKETGKDKFTFTPHAAVSVITQAQEEVEGRKVRLADADGGKLTLTDRLKQIATNTNSDAQ